MRKNRSQYASKKYPNLYSLPHSEFWVFRKSSAARRKGFYFVTEEKDEARAYKKGLAAFNSWVADKSRINGKPTLFRHLATEVLSTKEGGKRNTYRVTKNQIENHLIPAFGYLRCDQITRLKWEAFIATERRKVTGLTRFFNTHKALMEILRRAFEERIIERVPELKNPDKPSARGQHIPNIIARRVIHCASPDAKVLIEILWRQGPRPGEACRYSYDMIDWRRGEHGWINIPGEITKTGRDRSIPLNRLVARLLRARQTGSPSRFVFPSPVHPDRPIAEYKTALEGAFRRASLKAIPYDFRYTFITNKAKAGKPILDVARYTDTSPEMIKKIYAKSLPASMEDIADE